MKNHNELRNQRVRRKREVVCSVLLTILLVAWLTVALLAGQSAKSLSAGTTWGRTIGKIYFDTATRLDELVASTSPLRRVVVLPIAGESAHQYDFANLGAPAFARHLRARIAAGQLRHLEGLEIVAGNGSLEPDDIGVEITLNEFVQSAPYAPDEFVATFSTRAIRADGSASDLVPAQPFKGSNQTLPWFVRAHTPFAHRAFFFLAGFFLMVVGLYFAVIYFRLMGGSLHCPAWLAGPVNDLRASTGLIASSLVLLAGFVMLVLVFLLAPRTGDALDERRTHVDILVDGDEFMLPAVERGVATNPLSPLVRDLVSDFVGGLTASRGPAGASGADAGNQLFSDWFRETLPVLLRTPATEIRISHGSSWRIFAAAEGEAYTGSFDPLWPGVERERRAAIDQTFAAIRGRMPERGLGLPLPWNTNYLHDLDPVTMAALKGTGDSSQSRLARLVISSFQSPALPYLEYWIQQGSNRPPAERVYAVLLPGLPRSAMRAWESLEGRILTARAIAQRVVSVQRLPANLALDGPRLKNFGSVNASNVMPDVVAPLVNWNGVAMEELPNYGTARDLNADAAKIFGRAPYNRSLDRVLVEDFRRWLWGGDVELERIEVFTIPRAALFWLIGVLGLTFALAGVRCEMSAQGMQGWLPPVLVLFSAVVLPLVAGAWLHSRSDTTRYIVFGYADLAFWGALFLWYCLAVLPVFDGRARVGYRRDGWMVACMILGLGLAGSIPLWPAGRRLLLAQGSLALAGLVAAGLLVATCFSARKSASLRLTLAIVLAIAFGYLKLWGWAGQDVPAIFLLVLVITMAVSGLGQGVAWWQISSKADYDRIPWLKPANRLLLALVLTFTGAAALYCSFPAASGGGLISGYVSYSMTFCVVPFLLCAGVLILVDLLERDAL